MNLEKLLSELCFSEEIDRAVRQKLQNDEPKIRMIAETAYEGENFDFLLCRRMPLTRLAVVTYLLLGKYEEYRAKGAPEEMIFDTFRDVSLRAELYFKRTGKVGLTKDDVIWFRHIMNVEIFKIGVLQFQPFEMVYLDQETIGEDYMKFSEEQKEALPAGTPVINCHVQHGADLRGAEKSLEAAKAFFGTKCRAFLCYSWLLYPGMVERLPENSNIRRFAGLFTVIGTCDDPDQAMENLGDRSTTLGKLAQEKENLGFACGVIPIGDPSAPDSSE